MPTSIKFTPEQIAAIDRLRAFLSSPPTKNAKDNMISLSGAAGTGKTTCLKHVSELAAGVPTAWTGMTGKASQRLSEVAGVQAVTLHSALYEAPTVDFGSLEFTDLKTPEHRVLVVDEASMMTPKTYADLTTWATKGVKIILVGDPYQLPPILTPAEEKAHGRDFSVFATVDGPMLKNVMRSGNEIIEIATHLRDRGVLPRERLLKTAIEGKEQAFNLTITADPVQYAVDQYLDDPTDHLLVTWRNEVRMDANGRIRTARGMKSPLAKNEPILIRKNHAGLGLLNGDVEIAHAVEPGPQLGPIKTCYLTFSSGKKAMVTLQGQKQPLDGGTPYIADRGKWREYKNAIVKFRTYEPIPITYGYVYTAHLCQGSEARRVTVFLSKSELQSFPFQQKTGLPGGASIPFGVRWLYTAVTRGKARVTLVTDA
jgi:ATP-dependent exoDNAse (exonuclease V) alpha subunit